MSSLSSSTWAMERFSASRSLSCLSSCSVSMARTTSLREGGVSGHQRERKRQDSSYGTRFTDGYRANPDTDRLAFLEFVQVPSGHHQPRQSDHVHAQQLHHALFRLLKVPHAIP